MLARLSQLDPKFLRYETRIETARFHKADGYSDDPNHVHGDACWECRTGPHVYFPHALGLDDAQGVMFLCPKCFVANGGNVGTHAVLCWFASRVPNDAEPGPGRWNPTGATFEDLTLSPSVHLTGEGCGWHGVITNGEAT